MNPFSYLRRKYLNFKYNLQFSRFQLELASGLDAVIASEALLNRNSSRDVLIYPSKKFGDIHFVDIASLECSFDGYTFKDLGFFELVYCQKQLDNLGIGNLDIPFAVTHTCKETSRTSLITVNSIFRDWYLSYNSEDSFKIMVTKGIRNHEIGHTYYKHFKRFGNDVSKMLDSIDAEKEADEFALMTGGASGIFLILFFMYFSSDLLIKSETMKEETEQILRTRILNLCDKLEIQKDTVQLSLDLLQEFRRDYSCDSISARRELFFYWHIRLNSVFNRILSSFLILDIIHLLFGNIYYLRKVLEKEGISEDTKRKTYDDLTDKIIDKERYLNKFGVERYNSLVSDIIFKEKADGKRSRKKISEDKGCECRS